MSHYTVYRPFLNTLSEAGRDSMRKIVSAKQAKRLTRQEILAQLFQAEPSLHASVDAWAMSEEYLWERDGCPVIFPESAELVTGLAAAKFDMHIPAALDGPMRSFMVAMPAMTQIAGITVPSFMVTVCRERDVFAFIRQPFLRYVGGPCPDKGFDIPDEQNFLNVVISFNSELSPGYWGVVRCVVTPRMIPGLLSASTTREFNEVMGRTPELLSQALDDRECETQMIVLRLALSLLIYSATLPESLVSGLPRKPSRNIVGKLPDLIREISLSGPPRDATKAADHYRSWFFRQLRAERYYLGEHKHREVGSRFVFVRDTYVGRDIEAATLLDTQSPPKS